MSCTASAASKESRAPGRGAPSLGALPEASFGRAKPAWRESISKALRATTVPTSPSFMIWRAARATVTTTAAWPMSARVPWAGGISLQSKPILLDWPPP